MRRTFLPYSLLSLAAAIVATTLPAKAESEYVYRAKSVALTADAGPGNSGPEPVSSEVKKSGIWRQIGPGTYRTNGLVATARAEAGNRNRTLVFSYEPSDPAGLFDISFEPRLSELGWYRELRDRFVGSFYAMKTEASMKEGYLYLTSSKPIYVSGPAADFFDFRRVE